MTLVAILRVFPEERPTRQRVVGLVVGFAGVLVVVGIWQGLGTGTWLGIGACLLAITGYGFSFPYVRRHLATGDSPVGAMTLATGLLAMGAIQSAPVVLVTGYSHAAFTRRRRWRCCPGLPQRLRLRAQLPGHQQVRRHDREHRHIRHHPRRRLAGALFWASITWNQFVTAPCPSRQPSPRTVRLDRRGREQ
jgi:hypothetical protein